jgi:hypothetical protein
MEEAKNWDLKFCKKLFKKDNNDFVAIYNLTRFSQN